MPLVVTGSIGLDSIETPVQKSERILGGSCTYFAAAASFFGDVRIVGAVGGDFGPEYREQLKRFETICMEGLETRPNGKTFAWGGRYHENMNSRDTLFTNLGVLEEAPPKVPEKYKDSRFVFLANTHPKIQLEFYEQFPKRRLTVADTMTLWINIAKDDLKQLISRIDGLMVNEEEAQLYTEKRHPISAGKALLELGPKFVVIKRGEHGAVLVHREGIGLFPAFPTDQIIDPTGCGDSFAGALMARLSKLPENESPWGLESLKDALCYATAVASLTIEDMGLKKLLSLKKSSIDQRVEEYMRMLPSRV